MCGSLRRRRRIEKVAKKIKRRKKKEERTRRLQRTAKFCVLLSPLAFSLVCHDPHVDLFNCLQDADNDVLRTVIISN